MPELAKPLSLSGSILKEQRNSKSPGWPLVQMRKVLFLIGLASLVCPTIAPSLTDQRAGLPSQPVRFLPLKMEVKPSSVAAVAGCVNRVKVHAIDAASPSWRNPFRVDLRSDVINPG